MQYTLGEDAVEFADVIGHKHPPVGAGGIGAVGNALTVCKAACAVDIRTVRKMTRHAKAIKNMRTAQTVHAYLPARTAAFLAISFFQKTPIKASRVKQKTPVILPIPMIPYIKNGNRHHMMPSMPKMIRNIPITTSCE